MTDFDKLIKEKAEQAEYAYKPSAWKSFQRQTGMGHTTLKYWVAGVSSAVIIGGLTSVLLLRNGQSTQGDNSSPAVVAADTIALNVDDDASLKEDTILRVGSCKQETSRAKAVPAVDPKTIDEVPDTDAPHSAVTSNTKTHTAPRYGRPLVIDVDTIKDNVPTDEELRNGNSRLY
jgi:hypothetical protein